MLPDTIIDSMTQSEDMWSKERGYTPGILKAKKGVRIGETVR